MMRIEYRGWAVLASNGEEDDILALREDLFRGEHRDFLADSIESDIWQHGEYLSVRYWISDTELTQDELNEAFLKTLYGEGDAQYSVRYSEITGYLWTDEEIMVGGHDLLAELKSHVGKFVHLEITYSETA